MKDFDYYKTNQYKHPNRFKYKKKLIDEIDNTPLTKDQRKAELDKVDERVREWFKEEVKPHNIESSRLEKEFWADCRCHFAYDQYLTSEGVALLEYKAYEEGHSHGYAEVFSKLEDFEQFIDEIRKHLS